MAQRKKFLDSKLIKFRIESKNILEKRLIKSLQRNNSIAGRERIAFFIKNNYFTRHNYFYKSQNKLQCTLTYSFKVPSKKLKLSRFYLVKHVDALLIGGLQK